MNRRTAWVLSGLTVAVLTISGVLVGAGSGRLGFGPEEASGSTAGPVSATDVSSQPASQAVSTGGSAGTEQEWDDDDDDAHEDDDREQEHRYGDDDDDEGEHWESDDD